jgi:asparagine synthase (glutamine-hydrolysing)
MDGNNNFGIGDIAMCGFLGNYHGDNGTNIPLRSLLHKVFRSSDCESFYFDKEGRLELAYVSSSLIDIKSEKQPILNETNDIVTVCSGAIYNYIELTKLLKQKNHKFKSEEQPEIIPHLYEEYGKGFLDYLNGMYALALWDEKNGRLILARDRLGIKSMYYSISNGNVRFATEIKPLLRFPDISLEIDVIGLTQYLSYGYTLAPRTVLKNIHKLPAGCWMAIENGTITNGTYWDCNNPGERKTAFKEIQTELLEAFDASIQLHLRSDVPIGACLSGGIDSGLLVARASYYYPHLRTYTLRFTGSQFDESPLAEQVARKYDTKHKTFSVDSDALINLLPKMVWYCDEPLADSGLLPNFIINQLAAEDGVRVVLNGAGGDELFAGYTYYFPSSIEKKLLQFPLMTKVLSNIFKLLNPEIANKLNRAVAFETNQIEHYLGHITIMSKEKINKIIKGIDLEQELHETRKAYAENFRGDRLNSLLYADLKTYLTDNLMLLLDRTSMAHSIEARGPFLDYLFVEKVMAVPGSIKTPGGERKALLKEISRPFLPMAVIEQSKRGFNSPIQQWIRGRLGDLSDRILLSKRTLQRPWWNGDYLKKIVMNPKARTVYFHQLYTIFMLEIWFRIHMDNSLPEPPDVWLEDL